MDAAGIASFLVASREQQTRMDVAFAAIRNEQAMQASLLGLLEDSAAAGQALQAAPPPGMGQSLDITA